MHKEILFSLWLSALSGGMLTLGWLILQRILKFSSKTRSVYFLLRAIMLVYTIPVVTIVLKLSEKITGWTNGAVFLLPKKFETVSRVLFTIWLTVFLLLLLRAVIGCLGFAKHSKCRVRGEQWQSQILDDICQEMGVSKKIRLYQIYKKKSPYIMGIFRPAIYLPVRMYSEDELRMIFLHEVTHYKQKDMFWKPVFGVIRCVFWFFPPAIWSYREMERWSEYCCDRTCCVVYSSESYFKTIFHMASEVRKQNFTSFVPMWMENKDDICQRAEYIVGMERKRLQRKCFLKLLSAVIFSACIVGAGGADYGAIALHDKLYFAYASTSEEENVSESKRGVKEIQADSRVLDGKIFHTMKGTPFEKESIFLIDEQKIQPQEGYQTRKFFKEAGAKLKASVMAEPERETFLVGLMDADQNIYYIAGNDYRMHTFQIPKTGEYRIFVFNKGDVALRVCGTLR